MSGIQIDLTDIYHFIMLILISIITTIEVYSTYKIYKQDHKPKVNLPTVPPFPNIQKPDPIPTYTTYN